MEHETSRSMPGARKCPQCGAVLPAGALDGLCPACLLKQGATAETETRPEKIPFQPPSADEMARLFPQLEILGFIGKGGMGAVYKARQPALDRLVALKILPSQAASGPGGAYGLFGVGLTTYVCFGPCRYHVHQPIQVVAGLGLSEGAVRVAVDRLRRRYRELMREEIGQTLSDPAQVEEEMRALFSAFTE